MTNVIKSFIGDAAEKQVKDFVHSKAKEFGLRPGASNANTKKLNFKKIDYPPPPLIPFSPELQQEFTYRGIVDLTVELWKDHCEKKIDLSQPFCFGREKEILRISVLLSAIEMPSNILVTGTSGTGKTVMIQEIARQILMKPESLVLQGKHVLLMPQQTHGASEDLKFLAENVGKQAILVFDECHKSLTSSGPDLVLKDFLSFDFDSTSSKCKPLLAENKLSIIGLTDRLGNFLKRDVAMQRRFTLIELDEVGVEGTLDIIKQKGYSKKVSETLSGLSKESVDLEIPDETILTAIYLSMIYDKETSLPAKAYRILDPAVAYFFHQHPKERCVPPESIIDYIVATTEEKKPDVEEELEKMRDLAESPIPPHEPLAKYSTNLSAKARRGQLAPAYGRRKFIKNIAAIFLREEFNNILLIAPPGSGKTRVAEALAYYIVNGDLPDLKGKEVLLLNWRLAQKNLSSLIKSAIKYKGQFILVIDEAHRLAGPGINFGHDIPDMSNVGALISNPMGAMQDMMGQMGGGIGGSDSMNELKEVMGRGLLPSLLLTTDREADRIIKDPAFMRRFVKKKLKPLNRKQIMLILGKEIPILAKRYEIDDLSISIKAKQAIYYLSKIFHKGDYQPSASFKVLHIVLPYVKSKGIKIIKPKHVYKAVGDCENKKSWWIRNLYKMERAADHPSSQRIPDDEPLKRFSDDWTKMARMGEFPDTIGYEDEFAALIAALSGAECNNALIVGEAGTGKTTMIKRLANLMASKNENEIPQALRNKPLFALNLNELLENKRAFSEFLESAKTYGGQFVLFIDEVHLLFKGKNSGLFPNFGVSGELENLKPLLADGKITLIGATTKEDLKGIHFSGAIRRRFTAIQIKSPPAEDAIAMIKHTKEEFGTLLSDRINQDVIFEDEAIEEAVYLADPNQLPASAIRIIQAAAVEKQGSIDEEDVITVTANDLRTPQASYLDELEDESEFGITDALKFVNSMGSTFGHQKTKKTNKENGGFWHLLESIFTFIPQKIIQIFVRSHLKGKS